MFDIFKPKWKNSSVSTRLEAIKTIDNQNVLQGIVLYDVDQGVRLAALNKIDKDEVLYAVLLKATNNTIIDIILNKINDENILIRILNEYKNIEKLKIIIKKIKNKSKLNDLIIKTRNEVLKQALIEEVTDQETLYNTILLNQESDVALKASEIITDEKYLKLLFKNVRVKDVKINLVKNMRDDDFLKKIITSDKKEYALIAIKNIKNDDILFDIGMYNLDIDLRREAILIVKRKSYLSKLAKNEKNDNLRLIIVSRIENQTDLEYFATHDKSNIVRVEAIKSLDSYDFLSTLLSNEHNHKIVKTIEDRMNSDQFLIKVFKKTKVKSKKSELLLKITNQEIIKDIVLTERYKFIRKRAIKKLNDQALLKEIAENKNEQITIRVVALKNIEDDKVLLSLVSFCKNKNIVLAAIANISTEKILNKIILKESDILKVKAAVHALKTQKRFFEVAMTHKIDEIKVYAAKQIKEINLMKELYSKTNFENIKKMIFNKLPAIYKQQLQEENLYNEIISSSLTKKGKISALEKIISQKLLVKIVYKSDEKIIKMLAIKKISNKAYLEELKSSLIDERLLKLINAKLGEGN